MADVKDELLDNLDNSDDDEKITRLKRASSKIKSIADERDAERVEKQKMSDELAQTKKELEFTTNFSEQASKYPSAKDHRDEIKTKVLAGYTVEDATVSVLQKAGKLQTASEQNRDYNRNNALGGSADTTIPVRTEKTVQDMTQTERRDALVKAESEGNFSYEQGKGFLMR